MIDQTNVYNYWRFNGNVRTNGEFGVQTQPLISPSFSAQNRFYERSIAASPKCRPPTYTAPERIDTANRQRHLDSRQ
jgi:hypothetical protein